MFAFYFSVKTVRAMVLHQIGKRASLDEFSTETKDNSPDTNVLESDLVSKMKHSFDKDPVDDEDETPPHKPTYMERA